MRSTRWWVLGLVGLGLAFAPAVQAAYRAGADGGVTVSSEVRDDAYLAGQSVSVSAPIFGELFGIGQSVSVSEPVERSIVAAGETVTIKQGAGHNAYLGGRVVTLDGEYGHDVFVAGGTVVVEQTARIRGSLHVIGESIALHGTVDGDVRAGGTQIGSDASIGGTMTVEAEELSFSGGSIGGNLRSSSTTTVKNDTSVTVAGEKERFTPSDATSAPTVMKSASPVGFLSSLATYLLLGALVVLVLPKKLALTLESTKTQWGSNLMLGLAGLIGVPILAGLLFVTVIGWPFGVAALLTYAAALIVAKYLAVPVLGHLVLRAGANRWMELLVGALIVAVLGIVPVLGPLVKVAFFVGVVLPVFGSDLRWIWGLVYEPRSKR